MLFFSIIVPVYNRPEEICELLDSLTMQHHKDRMEIIVVEDGSTRTCDRIITIYARQLNLKYVRQENTGPAFARNHGARMAKGDILFFLDSDVTLPSNFFDRICQQLDDRRFDCFGTRDASHKFFTTIQKAISYSMNSLFTTGGIRGGTGHKFVTFYPRSYSMGVYRDVFEEVGGFSGMRFGEDIDLSMRIKEAGFKLALIDTTFVYHKRRTTLKSFFKQTFCSGTARIDIALRHRGGIKLVHALPSMAVLVFLALVAMAVVRWDALFLVPIVVYGLLIVANAYQVFREPKVAVMSLVTSAVQIVGYGSGFIYNAFLRLVLRRRDTVAFKKTFYK